MVIVGGAQTLARWGRAKAGLWKCHCDQEPWSWASTSLGGKKGQYSWINKGRARKLMCNFSSEKCTVIGLGPCMFSDSVYRTVNITSNTASPDFLPQGEESCSTSFLSSKLEFILFFFKQEIAPIGELCVVCVCVSAVVCVFHGHQ